MALFIALLSLLGIGYVRQTQRETQFHSLQSASTTVLNLQARAIEDGYFSWTALQNKVESGDLSEAEKMAADIQSTYPFVSSIRLLRDAPPPTGFSITGSGSSFVLDFSLKDDQAEVVLPGWKASVAIDAQALFDSLRSQERLVVDQEHGRELAYSVKARFENPLFRPLDYLLALIITAGILFPLMTYFSRQHLFFYESKGLESIIFLFEQTERLSANHSRQVAALSVFLGKKLGYSPHRLRKLYTAALLHDIGKISIPTSILLKEGPLTKSEQAVVQSHPILSARILKNFKELSHLSEIVLCHHERMDGSGYPEGRAGKDIPEESRIIAVVDVFEALTGDRPYREPLSFKEALVALEKMPLDQRLVATFEAEFNGFEEYRPPRWVMTYDRTLKNA